MGLRTIMGAAILLNFSLLASAQVSLTPPLKGALNLSGAFGEVRTDHLHTGIDYRTGGKIGLKVYSVDKGYISRIKFSPNGYGKAVYINHPNGTTSVYAHLDMLAEPFASYVKDLQYGKQSFAFDVELKPRELPVVKGQLIAWSGNSGSSGGPHLHFEVRNTKTQHALNPNFWGFPVTDNLAPQVKTVAFYRADSTTIINGLAKSVVLDVSGADKKNALDTVRVSGTVGFGLEAYDWLTPQSTRTGIYSALYTLNSDTLFYFKADSLSFGQGRYVNSLTDYGLRQQTGKRIIKLFIEPNNKLMGYYASPKTQRGFLRVSPDSIYNIKLIAADAAGLYSSIDIVVKGEKQPQGPAIAAATPTEHAFIAYNQSFSIVTDSLTITIPRDAFYTNVFFRYALAEGAGRGLSPIYSIGNPNIPLHTSYTLGIRVRSDEKAAESKTCIAKVEKDGKLKFMGGAYKNGYVKASLRTFGNYTIAIDTIPPVIVPLKRQVNGTVKIRYRVYDNFSDIANVNGYIDGSWALFEYDPKNELIFYVVDQERLNSSKEHSIRIVAEDGLGNISTHESTFSF